MGLMECDRNSCGNVCSKYQFDGRYYVCEECVQELLEVLGKTKCTKKYFDKKFSKFLKSEKGQFHLNKTPAEIIKVRDYINSRHVSNL